MCFQRISTRNRLPTYFNKRYNKIPSIHSDTRSGQPRAADTRGATTPRTPAKREENEGMGTLHRPRRPRSTVSVGTLLLLTVLLYGCGGGGGGSSSTNSTPPPTSAAPPPTSAAPPPTST